MVSNNKKITWNPYLAYAIGLLVTDGSLSCDGRHIDLTSKDVEQLNNFKFCLKKDTPISSKISGYTKKYTTRVQFSDVNLYKFLQGVGLTASKTNTIGALKIPKKYFFDFLRGHYDGDGSFYSYWDKRWNSSFMFYLIFASASPVHIKWIKNTLEERLGTNGVITKAESQKVYQLKYAKKDSMRIIQKMYSDQSKVSLSRKKLKIEQALSIVEGC